MRIVASWVPHSPPTQERSRATPAPHPTPPRPPAQPLKTPHTTRQLNAHHRPQPELRPGATPPARTATREQPHTTATPNRALRQAPAHDPAPATARAPSTNITHPPRHEAAPQHVNTHDDPMALDVDSLLELELRHTEDMEQHMDLSPLEPEPAASDPADPARIMPPRSPSPTTGRPGHTCPTICGATTPPTKPARAPPSTGRPSSMTCYTSRGRGLKGIPPPPPSAGAPTQQWEEEYAIDVTDMTAYVESVEDPEQDTILSLLAYHSLRWGHQVTLHRPQSGTHQWSLEQTAKWDISLQLTPEGFYILIHSGLPNTTPTAQALPLAQPQEDDADAPPPEECNWKPPTATTEYMRHRLTKHHLPHNYHATSDSRGRRTLPLQWASPEGTFGWGKSSPTPWRSRTCCSGTLRRTRSPLAHTSSSP